MLNLVSLLVQVQLVQEENDSFDWTINVEDGFLMKSYATVIRKRGELPLLEEAVVRKFKMWNLEVPSKVKVLAWRTVLDRNPTRQQLKRREILNSHIDYCCVFCFRHEEDYVHLFVECPILEKFGEKVGVWIGDSVSLTNLELKNYLAF